jgi:hypothetical protein
LLEVVALAALALRVPLQEVEAEVVFYLLQDIQLHLVLVLQ